MVACVSNAPPLVPSAHPHSLTSRVNAFSVIEEEVLQRGKIASSTHSGAFHSAFFFVARSFSIQLQTVSALRFNRVWFGLLNMNKRPSVWSSGDRALHRPSPPPHLMGRARSRPARCGCSPWSSFGGLPAIGRGFCNPQQSHWLLRLNPTFCE